MNHKFEIGDRVFSDEVGPLQVDLNTFTKKQLEIVEFIDKIKVRCKYFSENLIRPEIEYYEVFVDSLTFINKIPLDYKTLAKDQFWDKYYKKKTKNF